MLRNYKGIKKPIELNNRIVNQLKIINDKNVYIVTFNRPYNYMDFSPKPNKKSYLKYNGDIYSLNYYNVTSYYHRYTKKQLLKFLRLLKRCKDIKYYNLYTDIDNMDDFYNGKGYD